MCTERDVLQTTLYTRFNIKSFTISFRTIESYIEENVEIIFYDRFYTYEVMAGTYLVKNSDWSRNFLDGWANYEYRLPRSFHGSDNGVLNLVLDFC
ncbi:hypothetical protein NECAME_17634 [Necator americanus]|uniref:Uncharacterized protein n=1 Tax=Necator americanus TaxID=51031 RepID=W2TPA0_NECAM|nr:hypothetical protein NECAME_17634 [Necator americanus]ETN82802.1 hypothetical protein NECAME_17634 [Necator americanus]